MRPLLILLLLLTTPFIASCNEAKTTSEKQKDLSVLEIGPNDYTVGDKNAKVTFIEYSSLSCHHCKDFHASVFPKLKAEYIDSGKVQYVYRGLPINRSAFAGSKLTMCVDREKFFTMVSALFESQASWAYDEKYLGSLENIAKLAGISSEKFKQCQESKKLEDDILKVVMEASSKLHLQATPTFFINKEEVSGSRPYAEFKKIIDKKLSEATSSQPPLKK